MGGTRYTLLGEISLLVQYEESILKRIVVWIVHSFVHGVIQAGKLSLFVGGSKYLMHDEGNHSL